MDDSTFDNLTRSFAVPSRRAVFSALGAALVPALFDTNADDETLAKRQKRKNPKRRRRNDRDRVLADGKRRRKKGKRKKKKGGAVPSTATPPPLSCVPTCATTRPCGADGCGGSCGRCGSGQMCRTGQCFACPEGTPDCTGKVCGDDGCDGVCGTCSGSELCQQGVCVTSCDSGLTQCGNACVDTAADRNHCGGCTIACPGNVPCTGGVCECNRFGTTKCGNECVNTWTDPNHCGGCNNHCEVQPPDTCGTNGSCVVNKGTLQGFCGRYNEETVCRPAACEGLTFVREASCQGTGSCPDGRRQSCDDGFTCTIDTCDPSSGCSHTYDHDLCATGNPCVNGRCDPEENSDPMTGCVAEPLDGTPAEGCEGPCENDTGSLQCVHGDCQCVVTG